ncbi:death-associated protein kinase 1-like [Ptychodera flava]|uniref:death-associated protein kinase 1-like n=1 Tax=Ptychodera flava TaxID=63121 RepID=UPI003969BEB2
MFLGSGNAVFLLVFGMVDNENDKPLTLRETKEKEITHWLSFIKATHEVNPLVDGTSPFTEGGRPTVILVVSRADIIHKAYMTEADRVLSSIVQSMQKMFGKYLNIHDRAFLLDCRASGHANIERLRQCVHQPKKKVPKLCAEILKHVEAWTKNTSFPVISWNDYRHEMSKLHPFVGEEMIRMATSYLHDMGEILYMKYSDCDDDIVLRPQWLCSEVFGPLLATHSFAKFAKTLERKKFYSHDEIKQIFKEDWDVDRVFRLLEKFEILYKVHNDSTHRSGSMEKKYVITGMLDDCMPSNKWQKESSKEIYYGRRIECHDDTDSFSPGLFPRLQTRLYHTFDEIRRTPSDMWKNGIKVCDEVEGLVYMPKGWRAIHICVRGEGREDTKACHNLLDKLMNTIEDVLDISCPGTNVDHHILSSRSLKNHDDHDKIRYCKIETIIEAEEHSRRVYDGQFGEEEKAEDLLCVGCDTTLLRNFGYKADIKWMTEGAKQTFAAIMDQKQERRNDYRCMAQIVGMKYDEIKCLEEKAHSGTQHVLSTWSRKWAEEQHSAEAPGEEKETEKETLASNFSNLVKVLSHDDMQRDDAVEVIVEMFASLGIRRECEDDS